MAKNLEGTSSFDGNYLIKIWYRISQINQSITDNTSTIRVHLWLGTDDPYTWAQRWGIYNQIPITVAGQTKNITLGDFNFAYSWWNVGSVDFVVQHDSDGSKMVPFEYSCNIGNPGGYVMGATSFSGTYTADTIPRATSISSVSGLYLGSPTTISLSKKHATFTHTAWYRINGGNWVEIGSGYTDKVIFTVPLESGSSSKMQNTLDVCVRTMSGSVQVGADVYKYGYTITMPAYSPEISKVDVIDTNAKVVQSAGRFVQLQSKYKVVVNGATGKHGSTIINYRIFFAGRSVGYGNSSADIGSTNDKGTVTVRAEVTDSRGRKASKSLTIDISPYAPPKINAFLALRTGNGTNKAVNLMVSGKVSPLELSDGTYNRYTVLVRSSPAGKGQWSDAFSATGAKTDINISALAALEYDLTKAYDFKLTIADKLTEQSSAVTVATTRVVLALGKNNVGVGKVADDAYALDVGGSAHIDGNWLNSNGLPIQEWKLTEKDGSAITKKQIDVGSITDPGIYYVYAVSGLPTGAPLGGFYEVKKRGSTKAEILHATADNKLYIKSNGMNDKWEKVVSVKTGERYRDIGEIGTIIQSTEITKNVTGSWTDNMKIMLPPGRYLVFTGYKIEGAGKYLDYELKGTNIANTLYSGDKWEHDSMASGIVDVPGPGAKEFVSRSWSSSTTSVKRCYLYAMTIARNTYVNDALA